MKISLVTSAALASLLGGAIAHKPSPTKVVHLHVPTSQHAASHPTAADAVSAAESGPARHTAYTPKKGSFFHMKFSGFDHRLQKRATSYITGDGFVTTDQTRATVFFLDKGRLRSNGNVISANPTDPYIYFAANTTVGSITTTWTADNGIAWANASFTYGAGVAQYCQGLTDQRVYIILQSSPPGCNPVVASPAPTPTPTAASVTPGTTLASSTAGMSSIGPVSSSAVGSSEVSSATSPAAASSSASSSIISGSNSASSSAHGSSTAASSPAGSASSTAPGSSTAATSSSGSASSSAHGSSTAASSPASSASSTAPVSSTAAASSTGAASSTTHGSSTVAASSPASVSSTAHDSSTVAASSTGAASSTAPNPSTAAASSTGAASSTPTASSTVVPSSTIGQSPTSVLSSTVVPSTTLTVQTSGSASASATPTSGTLCANGVDSYFYGVGSDNYIVSCRAFITSTADQTVNHVASLEQCTSLCSQYRTSGAALCFATTFNGQTGACSLFTSDSANGNSTNNGDPFYSTVLIYQTGNTTALNANCPADDGLTYIGSANDLYSVRCQQDYSANQQFFDAPSTDTASCADQCTAFRNNGTACAAGQYYAGNGRCYFKTTADFAFMRNDAFLVSYVYLGPANSLPSSTSTSPTIASSTAVSSPVVSSSTLAIVSSTSASASATPLIASLCADGVGPYFYSVGTDNYGVSCAGYISSTAARTLGGISSLEQCTTLCSEFRTGGLSTCIATTFDYMTGDCSLQDAPLGNGTTSTTNPYFSTFLIYQSGNATATPNCPDDTGKTFYGDANDLYSLRCYADYASGMDFARGAYSGPAACAYQCSIYRAQGQTCGSAVYYSGNNYCFFKTAANFNDFASSQFLAYVYLGPTNTLPSSTSTLSTIASSTAASSTLAASSTVSLAPLCTDGISSTAGSYFYNVGSDSYIVSCQAHFNAQDSQITLGNIADLATCTQACSTYRTNGSYTCIGTNFNIQTSACVLLDALDGNVTSSQSDPQQTTLLITQLGSTTTATCPQDDGKTFAGSQSDIYSVRCYQDYNPSQNLYSAYGVTSYKDCVDICSRMRYEGNTCVYAEYLPAYYQGCYLKSAGDYGKGLASSGYYLYTAVYVSLGNASTNNGDSVCPTVFNTTTFYTTSSDTYGITCGSHYDPNGQTGTQVDNVNYLSTCVSLCTQYRLAGTVSCIGVNFNYGTLQCLLATSISGNFSDSTPVSSAFLLSTPGSLTTGNCPDDGGKTYVTSQGDKYEIRCSQAYSDGVYTSYAPGANLTDCANQCSASTAAGTTCLGSVLYQGNCYLLPTPVYQHGGQVDAVIKV